MDYQNTCGALIKQIHDELEKRSNNSLRSAGLTMAQVAVLLELEAAPDRQMPLKELEKRLHVAQSTAAGIVTRLEQKGLTESFGSPEDRRVKLVGLTAAGADCCRLAEREMDATEAELLSGLTETERTIFLTLLEKVCRTLQ